MSSEDAWSRRSFLRAAAAGIAVPAGLGGSPGTDAVESARGGEGRVPTLALLPFLARPTTESILVNVRNGTIDADLRLELRGVGETSWIPQGDREAVSADALAGSRAAALDAGCNAYVTKPIDFDTLLLTLDELLPSQSATALRRRASDRDDVDEMEKSLEAGEFLCMPGKGTRAGYIMRRLFPNYVWNYAHKAEGF